MKTLKKILRWGSLIFLVIGAVILMIGIAKGRYVLTPIKQMIYEKGAHSAISMCLIGSGLILLALVLLIISFVIKSKKKRDPQKAEDNQ